MYYFAYGSNMNHKQMAERCKNAKFICRAYLKDYQFIYDGYSKKWKGAVGNIIKRKGSKVWGGIFEINDEDLKTLDKYEGSPSVYGKQIVVVKDDNNKEYELFVYLKNMLNIGKPSENYKNVVIQGAKDCNLPDDYIKNTFLKI
ncbi:MAG: gamma-glutamylcyclotransferase family protein [Minisyncoccia bacterium]